VITSIVDDPNLPGLRCLADDPATAALLRYRPRRRCTLRISDDSGTHVVKVLADDRGEQFHRDAVELWGAAQRGELDFVVAEPFRWDSDTQSVWQGIVPGAPVAAALLASGGASMARRMGAALGTLARSDVRPSITATSDDQLRRTQRAVANAIRRVPALAGDLQEMLVMFATRHAALSPDRLVPVHGAPHMHQWLLDDDRLGLIDFDRFAMGEIELDIATLLTELDYEEDLSDAPAVIEHAVVDGFRSAGVDVDQSRLQLYRAHKRMSKVTREAWALRTNGERRARRHLPRIVEDLG
jgi:aminoglycoside phosphotransferase (APT) family kinase protein